MRMHINPFEGEWRDWLQAEISALPYDERAEILVGAIEHSNAAVSLTMADISALNRFRLSEVMRNAADLLEQKMFAEGARHGN